MTKDIADLAERFEWTADTVDGWRILTAETGPLRGDCDEFAPTALWLAEGKSMIRFWWAILTFRAVFWTVKGRRWGSHLVLYHRHYGWIDNQNPAWGRKKDVLRFPWLLPMVAIKMTVGWLWK